MMRCSDERTDVPAAPLPRRRLLALIAVCGACGILGWIFWAYALSGDPAQDWMVFYTAARAYFEGNLPLIFDSERLTAAINQRFAGWLSFTLNLHPWVYPPTFLLLFLPFGLLPPLASAIAFQLAGFAAAIVAVCALAGRGQARWILASAIALSPAAALNVMTGQNAFFSAAVLVAGFALIGRFPVLAGALLALLSVKPQLALMVPVALLAGRQGRALGGAAISGMVLVLASLALFGADIWRAWIELLGGANAAYHAWVTQGRLNGVSVFACASLAGAPAAVASIAQWLAIATAATFVWLGFRRSPGGPLPLAVLLAATILAAPHASASDDVLLAAAAALYITAPRRAAVPASLLGLAAAVWIIPLVNPPSVFRPGVLTPLLILLFLAALLGELRQQRPGAGA